MDDDECARFPSLDEDQLAYPDEDGPDEREEIAVNSLNDMDRRVGKRKIFETLQDFPENVELCHPIDWHMRMPLTLEEREAKRQKQDIEEDIVQRLTDRIIDSRRRKIHGEDEKEIVDNAMKDNAQVLMNPPIDGTPWIGISCDSNEQRFYIRKHRRSKVERNATELSRQFGQTALNSTLFREIVEEARKIREKHQVNENETMDLSYSFDERSQRIPSGGLWVNKYSPSTYTQLLSDDGINRNLMTWLKLWDECVFKKKIQNIDVMVNEKEKEIYQLDNGKIRRPTYKVVLLSGAAGLGKTTLAALVAKHAGYSVIEINASHNRNVADFENVLEGAVRSVRTIDRGGRPNCLIMDEIDGSPVDAIRYLVKALQATGKKAIRRPIICICNNLFTPSLRELRSIALNIQMTATKQDRIVERLATIVSEERIQMERSCLKYLVELCGGDVRLSINTLQFVSSVAKDDKRQITMSEIEEAVKREGLGATSIFESWSTVLNLSRHHDSKGLLNSIRTRSQLVEKVALEQGDDQFVIGLHSNYLRIPLPIGSFRKASKLFLFYDNIYRVINEKQNYVLMKYMPSFYISLHVIVATQARVTMKYPQAEQLMRQHIRESEETVASVRVKLAAQCTSGMLILDILPMIVSIVQPPIKNTNHQLYSSREMAIIDGIVDIMYQYNITYTPQVVQNETHYLFQPSIDKLTMWCLSDDRHRIYLPNTIRQMIAHRIQLASVRHSNNEEGRKNWTMSIMNGGKIAKKVPVYFKYNQGFSNAVKKNIRMSNLIIN